MREAEIVNGLLLEIGRRWPDSVRAWRNNSGALKDEHGRLVRFGLPGSADIIGIVGPSGRFLALECKATRGRPTDQQLLFVRMVGAFGGVGGVVWSIEEGCKLIEDAINGA